MKERTQKIKKLLLRASNRPIITYPQNLPIIQRKQEIINAILAHQVLIVAGKTGSGKTTQLPKICMEIGRGVKGLIGHTQPRRIAVRTVVNRIIKELKIKTSDCISYKVRFNDNVSDNTIVKLMTDGVLLSEIKWDRFLMQYDTIIIDEAHERNLNIDFLLGYLKKLLPQRPDLKIIITSATIDHKRFSHHFNNAPIIEISGQTFPVEIRYRPLSSKEESDNEYNKSQAIIDAINELKQENPGDILVFMNGEQEILNTIKILKKQNFHNTEILPLYARLSNREQNRVFQSSNSLSRIILSTNIAETSITVPGIKYVIDLGTARIKRYNYRTKIQKLLIEPISQASANQRKGRCGRLSSGICIRLYSEEDFLSRPEFTDPEIFRVNLASVILQMTAIGLDEITKFPFIETPRKRYIQDGIHLLEELGAITSDKQKNTRQLTKLGKKLNQLPIDPRLARMLFEAQKYNCVYETMIITAALSIQDPRERSINNKQTWDKKYHYLQDKESDFLTFVHLWEYLKKQQKILSSKQFRLFCHSNLLNYCLVCEWQEIYSQLSQLIKKLEISINTKPAKYQEIHITLLTGLLSNIGMKDSNKQEFIGTHNIRFLLFPNSCIFKKPPKWVMVAELMETSRLWGRIAARIDPKWIELQAKHLLKYSYSEPHWERLKGSVMAFETATIYGLPIVTRRKVNYSKINPALCRELFIRHALVEGNWKTHHAFFHQNIKLRKEIEELEIKIRRHDILVDDESIFNFYDQRISQEVISSHHFDTWWKKLNQNVPNFLDFDKKILIRSGIEININEINYPDFWKQNNLKLPLSYQFKPGSDTDGITVHIPLSLLNQVQVNDFEWHIPGLRHELIIALIKSLPKFMRLNFRPAKNYAETFLKNVTPFELPLLDSLEIQLKKITGITIQRENWHWEQVPDYLKIIFQIEDKNNQIISTGRSLTKIKETIKATIQKTISNTINDKTQTSGIYTWNFGTLPPFIEKKYNNCIVKVWPALVDEYNSVAIKLLDTQQEQKKVMWNGLRRLLQLNIKSIIKSLHDKLFDKIKFNLYFSIYDTNTDLINDCISCGLDHIIKKTGGLVWTEKNFFLLHKQVSKELNDTVIDIASQVKHILTMAFNIKKQIQNTSSIITILGILDIKEQLNNLVYRDFISINGFHHLDNTLRYLNGIEERLKRMTIDPRRDYFLTSRITNIQNIWKQKLKNMLCKQSEHENIQAIRWMIEELRISFFSKELKTLYPISENRILQEIEKITI